MKIGTVPFFTFRRGLRRAAVFGGAARAGRSRGERRRAWNQALANLRRAEAAERVFRVQHVHPADRAYHAIRSRWPNDYDFSKDSEARAEAQAALAAHEPFEERLNDLVWAKLIAVQRLLRTRAPDLPALAMKIALAVDHEIAELEGGERCLAALKADARLLAKTAHRMKI